MVATTDIYPCRTAVLLQQTDNGDGGQEILGSDRFPPTRRRTLGPTTQIDPRVQAVQKRKTQLT